MNSHQLLFGFLNDDFGNPMCPLDYCWWKNQHDFTTPIFVVDDDKNNYYNNNNNNNNVWFDEFNIESFPDTRMLNPPETPLPTNHQDDNIEQKEQAYQIIITDPAPSSTTTVIDKASSPKYLIRISLSTALSDTCYEALEGKSSVTQVPSMSIMVQMPLQMDQFYAIVTNWMTNALGMKEIPVNEFIVSCYGDIIVDGTSISFSENNHFYWTVNDRRQNIITSKKKKPTPTKSKRRKFFK